MKKRTLKETCLMFVLLLSFSICNCLAANYSERSNPALDAGQLQKDSINPVEVFDQVWQIFNTNYPYFEQKGIDWSALYKVYKSKLTPESTDDELFSTLCAMLGNLNDGLVSLQTRNSEFTSGSTNGLKMEDFSWKLVRDKYLKGNYKATPDSLIFYGWIDNEVAYLRIRRFPSNEVVNSLFDPIIQELIKAKGIIVEVRGNSGGTGSGVQAIASRFADQQRLYEKEYWRMGPKREFSNLTYHYIKPKGPAQFTAPVVLLQNKFSGLTSERFALAMRVLPNVTSVGDMTGGYIASSYPERLINGWLVSLPYSYAVDQNDFCWEGIGVPPNLRLINTKEDIAAGNDKVLELSVNLIKAGGHVRKEAKGSLKDLRISLVYQFLESSEKIGVPAAVAEFKKLQKNSPEKIYFSFHELMLNTTLLFSKNKMDVAAALLELGLKSFPDDMTIMSFLAQAYVSQKQPEKAKELYSKVIKYKTYFPWERSALSKAEAFLNNK